MTTLELDPTARVLFPVITGNPNPSDGINQQCKRIASHYGKQGIPTNEEVGLLGKRTTSWQIDGAEGVSHRVACSSDRFFRLTQLKIDTRTNDFTQRPQNTEKHYMSKIKTIEPNGLMRYHLPLGQVEHTLLLPTPKKSKFCRSID